VPIPVGESVVHPHNQYAVSKYCQELYALTLGKRFDIPTVVMRYSITQGPRQSFRNAYSGILRIFTLRLLNGLPPVIYEDGRQLRDYVYVGDVAAANLLALQNKETDFEIYNVGGGGILSVCEYADLVKRTIGTTITPEVPGEFRFGDTRHVISDVSKLKGLGWNPIASMEQIVTEYVSWAKSQPELIDHYGEAERKMKNSGVIRYGQK
jgi:dTDP-L-rhamnose 4-epimerase